MDVVAGTRTRQYEVDVSSLSHALRSRFTSVMEVPSSAFQITSCISTSHTLPKFYIPNGP